MTGPRRLGIGVGLTAVSLYVAVALLTQATGHRVRPLFEGVGNVMPYEWKNPPRAFAAGNVVPTTFAAQLKLGPQGSDVDNAASSDGQVIVSVAAGSVPPHPPDTSVTVTLEPLDAFRLGPLPDLQPDGNAYHVTFVYTQTHTPLAVLAKPGTIVLRSATNGQNLLFSPDGKAWQRLQGFTLSGVVSVTANFTETGYFIAARHGKASRPGGGSSLGAIAIVAGAAAVGLLGGGGFGWTIRRRRRRRPRGGPGRGRSRRQGRPARGRGRG